MIALLSILVTLLALVQVAISSSPSSLYTPVTALDKYGNSIQLQNARQAAVRHGRLVVAARSLHDDAIVVVSVQTPKLGKLLQPNTTKPGVLQKLWTEDAACYLACTGVKADATWLVHTMRQYSKRLWDRYDVGDISQERMTQALSQTLLEFMGYNRAQEWNDGVKVGEDETSWGRPLGLQTIVISPSSPIVLVEPSGVTQSLEYVAIGKESDAVMRALRERYTSNSATTMRELKDLLVDIIRQQIEGQRQSTELIVEAVSKEGVEVSSVPLRIA